MARSWFVVRRAKFHGNIKILLLGKFEFIFHFENSDQILKIAIYLHTLYEISQLVVYCCSAIMEEEWHTWVSSRVPSSRKGPPLRTIQIEICDSKQPQVFPANRSLVQHPTAILFPANLICWLRVKAAVHMNLRRTTGSGAPVLRLAIVFYSWALTHLWVLYYYPHIHRFLTWIGMGWVLYL